MLHKLISASIFALLAFTIMKLVNESFTHVYSSVEASVQKPYIKAQSIYDLANSPNATNSAIGLAR